MMKLFTLALCLFVSITACAEDPVTQAKANLIDKHHKVLVAKAEALLTKKALLEKELSELNGKLEQLSRGEDVDADPDDACVIVFSPTTPSAYRSICPDGYPLTAR